MINENFKIMKQIAILTAILMFVPSIAQGVVLNPIAHKDTQKAYDDYAGVLRQHDVFITLPQNYTPVSIRGLSYAKTSIGNGEQNLNMDCQPIDIGAIVEDDSCRVAICYPEIFLDVRSRPEPYFTWTTRGSQRIESDLRMIHEDMHLDVRPMINIIAEEDMSRYANADTAVIYEFDMLRHNFMDTYSHVAGIYLRKKNHPAMLIRLMFNSDSFVDKDKYIQEALDNIRFGDNPSDTFVELEKKESGMHEFAFPTRYRTFTGILPDINDETLEEINRVKAWCDAHGMKELPRLDDSVLEALNRAKKSRKIYNSEADSILNSDLPEEQKILLPRMCDTAAEFPGDEDRRNKYWEWLDKNMRYPKEAVAKGIEGSVLLNFTVCADGTIKDITIDDTSKNANIFLKNEAIRLFKSMPHWTPAMYKGNPVNSQNFGIVNFRLPKKKDQEVSHKQTTSYAPEEHIYDMKSIPTAPNFKGGSEGLANWIQEHIQYPAGAAKAKIEGRVIVEFIIDTNGKVSVAKVVRGINDTLNNEALRVIRSLPSWTPGYANGKPVKTRYTYPVTFKLAKAK